MYVVSGNDCLLTLFKWSLRDESFFSPSLLIVELNPYFSLKTLAASFLVSKSELPSKGAAVCKIA